MRISDWSSDVCSSDLPEQIERYINPIWRGERHAAYAITDEGAGSNVDDIQATATRSGNGYVLNGEKWHVTSGNKDRQSVVEGKSVSVRVDLGGRSIIKTKHKENADK